MESTQNVFQKADDINRCLQRVVLEYQRRIHQKNLDFTITAMSLDHNGKILLAGDANGLMYWIEVESLEIQVMKRLMKKQY